MESKPVFDAIRESLGEPLPLRRQQPWLEGDARLAAGEPGQFS